MLDIDRQIRECAYPNCARLAREWEVSVRTVMRDLDYLRDELQAPIAYDRLKHGFFYTEPSFSLPALSLSESDLFSVCVARTVLARYKNTPLYKTLAKVFEQIREALPDSRSVNPEWVSERIFVFQDPATRIKAGIWATIATAIRENRRLSIRHAGPRSAARPAVEREVDPYYLVNHKGEWYLSSYCHLRKAIRTFAVSRITRAALLDATFRLPAGMTRARMFGDQFGIIWNNTFRTVRIRFSPAVAPYIRERQWHPKQKFAERRGGGLVLEFATNHLHEVKDWVLAWGADATVLAPEELAADVKAALEKTLINYRPTTVSAP
ncbi:MAG: WYL domain-containing protein [Planctomycetes bacterium]|nr:WYL domain-containing protein [Planctomycetota bacterium]